MSTTTVTEPNSGPDKHQMMLIFIHGFANLLLGASFLLFANNSAENVLTRIGFPGVLWPSLWAVAGVTGIMGVWIRPLARFSFTLAIAVMLVFSIASGYAAVAYSMLSAIPTMIFLLYITFLLGWVASSIRKEQDVIYQLRGLAEKGKSALGNVSDGTNT
jgi:predicted lysophospholipase L1 biosynthesis ABC-type transport system permease subunit